MCRFPASGSSWESLAQGSVSMKGRRYRLRRRAIDSAPEATMAGVPQLMLDTGGYPTNSSAPQGDPAVRATTAERPLAL